jgi:predicted nucleic acid-binding protein
MALRRGLAVAHCDRDFDAIRRHCGLQTLPLF